MITLLTTLLTSPRNVLKRTLTMMKSWCLLMLYRCLQRYQLIKHAHIRNKLTKDKTLHVRTKLSIEDIIKLLRFTLTNSYFNYNKITYKQIHGCAMGSPVSPIVANLCMHGGN
jgi:hypothetical protein